MNSLTHFAIVLILGVAPVSVDLDESEFRKLHRQLNPANEIWKSIPWRTSLVEAQRVAATEGKLIFIWAMDGHPLGCT